MKGDFTSPWVPISSPRDLKALGKLGEEASELATATSRCIIQGLDEANPETGKINRKLLLEEIADVLANIELVRQHFKLDEVAIQGRMFIKSRNLFRWYNDLPVEVLR